MHVSLPLHIKIAIVHVLNLSGYFIVTQQLHYAESNKSINTNTLSLKVTSMVTRL